jgi:hypothetical protein
MAEIPRLDNKDENWLTSFTHQAVLSRNEPQMRAADEQWRRRGRPDVVPRVREQFGRPASEDNSG